MHDVLFLRKLLEEVFLQNEYVKQVSEILEQETEPKWGEEAGEFILQIPFSLVEGCLRGPHFLALPALPHTSLEKC